MLQTLEREREMRAATRADDGVDLVDDDRAHRAQHVTTALRSEQQIQRFGGGDQNVRRRFQHRRAFGSRRVAGAYRGRDARRTQPALFGETANGPSRLGEILVNVSAQCLQRRNVDDAHLVRERLPEPFDEKVVQCAEECGERLSGAGRRGDERVLPLPDRAPSAALRCSRLTERLGEPVTNHGMKLFQGHRVVPRPHIIASRLRSRTGDIPAADRPGDRPLRDTVSRLIR